jgi:GNAT superfamily N-acetyltransferase
MLIVTRRVATAEDVREMARLREASGWSGGALENTMLRYFAGEHHPQQALASRVGFVAKAGETMTGFIAGHRTTRFDCDGELQWLLVAPTSRGGPTAGRLLGELAAWFAREGVTRVCVNVAIDNDRARRFYARYGAVELGEHWMVWQDITALAAADAPLES